MLPFLTSLLWIQRYRFRHIDGEAAYYGLIILGVLVVFAVIQWLTRDRRERY